MTTYIIHIIYNDNSLKYQSINGFKFFFNRKKTDKI